MSANGWGHGSDNRPTTRVSISRGYIESVSQDGKIQRVKGSTIAGTVNEDIDHAQPIGFTSNPGGGDRVECLFVDGIGDASQRLCLMVIGDREGHRKVAEGGSAIYAPGNQAVFIEFTKEGVLIEADGQPVKIAKASSVTIESDGDISLKAAGTIDLRSPRLKHNGVEVGDKHRHKDTKSGPDTSGVPV